MRLRRFLILLLLICPWLQAQDEQETERILADKYVGKVLTLRGFYTRDTLDYDSAGEPKFVGHAGPWTLCGKIEITRLKVKKATLEVEGNRMWVEWVPDSQGTRQMQLLRPQKQVFIRADLGSVRMSQPEIERLLGRIFVSPADKMSELVPEHWRRFFAGTPALAPSMSERGLPSGTSPEGVAAQSTEETQNRRIRIAQGVSKGNLLKKVAPVYPEPAKMARLQGAVILQAVIEKDGRVIKLSVLQPLGLGTEESAVDAVSKWVYKPYLLAGEPVQVETKITINYQLN